MAREHPPFIYIVSGGTGASGEQVVHTVLAQFPESSVPVTTAAHIRRAEQAKEIAAQAAANNGTIVHTVVEDDLRRALVQYADEYGVVAIDLMGPLLDRLSTLLQQDPLGQPGLYRRLNQAYFERVAAIDYAMAHDDGLNAEGWPEAEIVLVGVSRVGKTPLSMYLAVLGWKVANLPLVPSIDPPPSLYELDSRCVIGLTIDPTRLVFHREQRRRRLGAPGLEAYTDPKAVFEEIERARQLCRRGGFTTIDVTDKPIEASANQVIDVITRRFGKRSGD
jgi:regulator of PEP synthase PpsR (kinase-PPPase family)